MKKDVVKCSVNFWLFSLFRVWLGNMKRFSNSFNYYTIYWLCFVFLKKSFSYFTFFVNNLLLSVFVKENMALNFHSHWLFFLTYVSFCKFSFFAKFLSSRVGQWNNIVDVYDTIGRMNGNGEGVFWLISKASARPMTSQPGMSSTKGVYFGVHMSKGCFFCFWHLVF